MMTKRCRTCGTELPHGAKRCPACGADQAPGISRVWVLAFFVMGIFIGLLLLVLEQGGRGSWHLPNLPDISEKSAKLEPPPSPTPKKKTYQPTANRPGGAKPAVEKPTATVDRATVDKPVEDKTAEGKPSIAPLRCDRKTALQVRERARSLASLSEQDNVVRLTLTREWEYYSPGHRRSFVEAFSEADRCLQGHFREIHFLYQGNEVATVNRVGAVQMK